jgi:hypothetical protein
MKKTFAIITTACFLLTSFIPIFTLTKGAGHVIGHMSLWIIYPGLVDMIRIGDLRYVPLALLWIGIHLCISIAPAWIVVRILKRRKQNKAEQAGAGYPPQSVGSPDP